tara:strand:- start:22 stop:807 length:786 start_codon:yes stop_codon:yes gene_type:complete
MKKFSLQDLFISEPEPLRFGNGENEQDNPNWTSSNWLKSRFHFSFAEWSGGRTNFGCLRVVNDDIIQPNRGFGTHGHRDIEIVTYIIHGGLTHKDSIGNEETLGRGSIQFMTAGTGVMHSEHNKQLDQDLRLIQSWIIPREQGLTPQYGSFSVDDMKLDRQLNQWFHLVSDIEGQGQVQINQDFNLFVSEIEHGNSIKYDLSPTRQAYVVCLEGGLKVNDIILENHEAVEIKPTSETFLLNFHGQNREERTHLLLYEMGSS